MRSRSILLLAVVLSMSACSRSPLAPDGTQITFSNQTSMAITEASFSSCDDLSGFGANLLGAALQPGQQATFATSKGCHDLQVVFQDGRKKQNWAVTLAAGAKFTWAVTP